MPPPRRDVVVADGEPIAFGGVEITPVLIPGHTPGALGFVFRVADGARSHTAALFGGSILLVNRIPDDGLRQYVQSLERFGAVTQRLGVDVEIQNHPLYDGFATKLERLAARAGRRPASVRRRHGRVSALSHRHERVRERAARAPLDAKASARAAPPAGPCRPDRESAG